MKKIMFFMLLVFSSLLACQGQQGIVDLKPADFETQIKGKQVQLVDVRTAGEYDGGFIRNSVNYDVNEAAFETQIQNLDKSKPVYVYCLSGGRSKNAAAILAKNGFQQIYNLQGGIMNWKYEGKEIVYANPAETKNKGMSMADFKKMLASKNKPVLVEFYATWCAPCKVLKPKVEAIGKEHADKLEVITIDVDQNKDLADSLKINAIPLLQYYKNQKKVWSVNDGGISTEALLKKLKL